MVLIKSICVQELYTHIRCPGCKQRLMDMRMQCKNQLELYIIDENEHEVADTEMKCPRCKLHIGITQKTIES